MELARRLTPSWLRPAGRSSNYRVPQYDGRSRGTHSTPPRASRPVSPDAIMAPAVHVGARDAGCHLRASALSRETAEAVDSSRAERAPSRISQHSFREGPSPTSASHRLASGSARYSRARPPALDSLPDVRHSRHTPRTPQPEFTVDGSALGTPTNRGLKERASSSPYCASASVAGTFPRRRNLRHASESGLPTVRSRNGRPPVVPRLALAQAQHAPAVAVCSKDGPMAVGEDETADGLQVPSSRRRSHRDANLEAVAGDNMQIVAGVEESAQKVLSSGRPRSRSRLPPLAPHLQKFVDDECGRRRAAGVHSDRGGPRERGAGLEQPSSGRGVARSDRSHLAGSRCENMDLKSRRVGADGSGPANGHVDVGVHAKPSDAAWVARGASEDLARVASECAKHAAYMNAPVAELAPKASQATEETELCGHSMFVSVPGQPLHNSSEGASAQGTTEPDHDVIEVLLYALEGQSPAVREECTMSCD